VTDHNHDHGRGVLSQLAPEGRELKALIPGVYEGFAQLHTAAFAEGVLDKKMKELLALAIAIAVRCDGCIASHARGAAVNKATEAEVAETIGVAIAMSGGRLRWYPPPRVVLDCCYVES
jgi:AhpD family alkylhydroperoxidase